MIVKKRFILMTLMFFTFVFIPTFVNAHEKEERYEQLEESLLNELDVKELNDYWKLIQEEYGIFLKDITGKNLQQLIKNHEKISIASIVKGVVRYIFYEIIINGKLLGILIILTLFSAILQTMLAAFEQHTVSKVANFIVFTALLYITLHSFYLAISYAKTTIETMSGFMVALFPLMLALIASLGQITSVAIFHPLAIFLIHFSSLLLSQFIFPLLYVSALLMIVSQFNEQFKVNHLAELLRTISLTVLIVYLTVFIAILSVHGTVTAIQDGVALKTTKFIAGNFIPIVGRTLTDAADTILASALLIKNAIGVVGLIVIVLFATFPAIKISILAFIYKLVASLLQPLGKNAVIKSLNTMSQYMMYILACLTIVTFTFFLTIVIIISASNIPLLLR